MASRGTFVLADIGGYTSFLSGVAIEHGTEITEDLLNTVLRCNRNRWTLANVEGDCIFFYTEGDEPPGELLGHVRAMYRDFCVRTIDIAERAACPCGACTRTGELSLKFIVHAGQFDTQKIANRTELVGPDVITAHRLLKNSASLDEYVLLTDAYAPSLDPPGLPASRGEDEYEHCGTVRYSVVDLAPVREEVRLANWRFVGPDEARISFEIGIDAAPDRVWRALTDHRELMQWEDLKESRELPAPRSSAGNMHRCVFPDGSTLVRLSVAMEPDRRRVTERWHFTRLLKDVLVTNSVVENDEGSSTVRCYSTYRRAIPILSWLAEPAMRLMAQREMRKSYERLKEYCEGRSAQAP